MRGRSPGARDRAYDLIAFLGIPAPHVVRAVIAVALVVGVIASATVASSEALPDDPLYDVKLATEDLRLRLAQSAEDRAAVELSMAEHRLIEAERLAQSGRTPDALVAASTYGLHLANAAAELAAAEAGDARSQAAVDQLRVLLAQQQKRAGDAATHLAADPRGAPAAPVFLTVASFAPVRGGADASEDIAQHAAAVTEQLVAVAEGLARSGGAPAQRPPERAASAGPPSAPPPGVAAVPPTRGEAVAPRAPEAARAPGAVVAPSKAQEEPSRKGPSAPGVAPAAGGAEHAGAPTTLERTRQNAEKAAEAAEKAKQAHEKAPEKGREKAPERARRR